MDIFCQMCKEVAEGLRILIDFNLRRVLLYRNAGELDQYDRVMSEPLPARQPHTEASDSNSGLDVEQSIFNGNSPTVSSVESAPSSITW